MFGTRCVISEKFDKVKVLKLFSYLQNCQSYGPGSVEKSPKTGSLIPTGNGSSPTLTKLDVDIPHESSSNPWNFAPCGSNHNEGEKDCPQCLKLELSPLENSLVLLVTLVRVIADTGEEAKSITTNESSEAIKHFRENPLVNNVDKAAVLYNSKRKRK